MCAHVHVLMCKRECARPNLFTVLSTWRNMDVRVSCLTRSDSHSPMYLRLVCIGGAQSKHTKWRSDYTNSAFCIHQPKNCEMAIMQKPSTACISFLLNSYEEPPTASLVVQSPSTREAPNKRH